MNALGFTRAVAGRQYTEQHCRGYRGRPIMLKVIPEVTAKVLQAFADAWNRHDVDALMSFMTEDCIFESSAGADVCGTRYVGREATARFS